MKKRLLAPENICLQIIDVQQSLMAKIGDADDIAATVALMIHCGRIMNIPMVANTQYRKGLGPFVASIEPLIADIPCFDKVEFNSTKNGDTEAFLDNLPESVTTMVLVGVETHICIYQTAMGLLSRGFSVWVVSDGVGSRKDADHKYGLTRMGREGVVVGSAEMLIYELLAEAGTPHFKQVLPYIVDR